ncbi:hypothetical protein MKW92_026658, partial [Papaver armeniacum]
LIAQIVFVSKEIIARFQGGGDRMMRIEWVKSLLMATLSSLCRPEGKIGLYRRFFAQIANLCVSLLRLEIRGSQFLPRSVRDAIISSLFATLRTQGLVRSVFLTTPGIGSYSGRVSREIKNVPSSGQTIPAKNSSENSTLKRKSEGDENKCPICFDFMKDEKDEKGTTRFLIVLIGFISFAYQSGCRKNKTVHFVGVGLALRKGKDCEVWKIKILEEALLF